MIYLGLLFICSGLGFLVVPSAHGVLVGGTVGLFVSMVVMVATRIFDRRMAAYLKHKHEHPDPLDAEDAEDAEFLGTYMPHWELDCFVAIAASGTVERWVPHFPGLELARLNLDLGGRHATGKNYRMRLRGRRGPRGEFGHKGICSRELFIVAVLECEQTDESTTVTAGA